jgi:hypothetical protein
LTNIPAGLTNVVAIAAGEGHSLALKADGTVVSWGADSSYGLTNVPAGLTNVVAIAAGVWHSLALVGDAAPAITLSPAITVPPANRTLYDGASVTFQVMAVGVPPLMYQWQFNGTNLPGATNSTLVLPSVQLPDAGRYRVLVSNAQGVVTSREAFLQVLLSWEFSKLFYTGVSSGEASCLDTCGPDSSSDHVTCLPITFCGAFCRTVCMSRLRARL